MMGPILFSIRNPGFFYFPNRRSHKDKVETCIFQRRFDYDSAIQPRRVVFKRGLSAAAGILVKVEMTEGYLM